MLFLKSLRIFTAMWLSIGITLFFMTASITMNVIVRKNKNKTAKAGTVKLLRAAEITLALLMGFSFADTGMIISQTVTAMNHGMAREPSTAEEHADEYINTLQQVLIYNQITHECSDIDENDDLTGKILVYVRYDCPDCHRLYENLPAPTDDILYISSRTDIGHKVMDKYEIMLTDVPSAVYIAPSGTVTIVPLAEGTGDNMHFNISGFQQLLHLQYQK